MENGKRFKYNAPVSPHEDVNKMYNKIQRLSEQDQLSIMRREVKFKKLLFSDLPSDFKLFRQHNISAKIMYQNLLQLHAVDKSNQEIISVEDIYEITETLSTITLENQKEKAEIQAKCPPYLIPTWLLTLNGHHMRRSLLSL